jgi:hypothetical protein
MIAYHALTFPIEPSVFLKLINITSLGLELLYLLQHPKLVQQTKTPPKRESGSSDLNSTAHFQGKKFCIGGCSAFATICSPVANFIFKEFWGALGEGEKRAAPTLTITLVVAKIEKYLTSK